MKTALLMRQAVCIITMLLIFVTAQAQERIEDVMTFTVEDADKILDAFIRPAGETAGFLQAEGWYNTAKPLRKLKFNVQIMGNGLFVRQQDRTFSLPNLNLQSATVIPGEEDATTVYGDFEGDIKVFNEATNDTVRIPAGAGLPIVPFPVIQFNLGLIKNTELSVRFFPAIDIEGSSGGLIGIGIKHDIKQWIPSIALAPYSLSLVGSYSSLNIDYNWDIANVEVDDQFIRFDNQQWSIGLIGSKRFAIFTVFGGVRYDNSRSTNRIEGTYLVGTAGGLEEINLEEFPELFDKTYENSRIGLSLGGKINLGVLSFQASGTISNYTTINAGLGIGFNE
ncbi:MAG: DUF6588 family protein [Thermonemataceae bacterium]